MSTKRSGGGVVTASADGVCVVVAIMLTLSCVLVAVRADDKNITRLLNNQAIVTRQIMCVLEKSPCDQLGRQLKGSYARSRKIARVNERIKGRALNLFKKLMMIACIVCVK